MSNGGRKKEVRKKKERRKEGGKNSSKKFHASKLIHRFSLPSALKNDSFSFLLSQLFSSFGLQLFLLVSLLLPHVLLHVLSPSPSLLLPYSFLPHVLTLFPLVHHELDF